MRLAQKAAPSGSGLSLSWALQELRKQLGGDGFSLEGHLHRRPTGLAEARPGDVSSQQSGLSSAVRLAVESQHARAPSARVCPPPAAAGGSFDLSAVTPCLTRCRGRAEACISRGTPDVRSTARPLPAPRVPLAHSPRWGTDRFGCSPAPCRLRPAQTLHQQRLLAMRTRKAAARAAPHSAVPALPLHSRCTGPWRWSSTARDSTPRITGTARQTSLASSRSRAVFPTLKRRRSSRAPFCGGHGRAPQAARAPPAAVRRPVARSATAWQPSASEAVAVAAALAGARAAQLGRCCSPRS